MRKVSIALILFALSAAPSTYAASAGSTRIGGTGSSGKGSHYIGGSSSSKKSSSSRSSFTHESDQTTADRNKQKVESTNSISDLPTDKEQSNSETQSPP